jgi:hypothetical protein
VITQPAKKIVGTSGLSTIELCVALLTKCILNKQPTNWAAKHLGMNDGDEG